MIAVSVLLTMAVTWAAYGQAGGGGGGRGRGGFGMMGPQAQKAVADLQAQVAKLKAIVDANAKAMEGGYQNMSEEDRAKMKERSTEQQAIMAAIQKDVDQLRVRQMAAEYAQSMTALKDAQASAEKEKAKETAQKLGQIIAEREKQMEEKVTAMGMTMDDLQKMGTRGGGRRQQ
jgi:DNA primase large subunit